MSIGPVETGRVYAFSCYIAVLAVAMACSTAGDLAETNLDVARAPRIQMDTRDTNYVGIPIRQQDGSDTDSARDTTQDTSCNDLQIQNAIDHESEACASPHIIETEWQQSIPSTEETPDLSDARVRLYIPCEVEKASGLLIFSHIGVGEWEYDHETWRASAAAHSYALMMIELSDIHDRVAPWAFPEQSALFVTQILSKMAEQSKHEELRTCPLFFFGHSAGGFWFTRMIPEISERTAGFVAFHGSLTCDALFEPDSLIIPGLFLVAEYDPIWIRKDSFKIVERGRKNGARWSLVVEPDAGHWDVDLGRHLMVDFTETVFRLRIGQENENETGAMSLLELPASDGWLGQLDHQAVYNGDEEFEGSGKEIVTGADIAPWNRELANSGYWLVSESFAESWLSYELSGR